MMIRLLSIAILAYASVLAWAQTGQLTVNVDQPGHRISPTFFGLMTEEINHCYDGGLYAELIQNRALRDAPELAHWSAVGSAKISLDTSQPVPSTALVNSVRVEIADKGGAANDGYWGIPLQSHTSYKVSFYAKAAAGFDGAVTVGLVSATGAPVFSSAAITGINENWAKYSATLRTGKLDLSSNNRLVISADHPGTLWLTQVSLMPPTYKNRPNGNRPDLMELMKEMKPAFLRLPGGNYLEGDTVAERFDWKATLHDISQRPGHQGPWRYRSSDGLGLLEFLEWCEDLHMQPVLGVYAGWSFRERVAPGKDLEPYVQEALDEVEYVTGDASTKWGKVRAMDGHPKPFPLTYVEIGNEDPPVTYEDRFAQFYDAFKAHYPQLQLIATAPVKSRKPDLVDDHYYRDANAMARDAGHYDKYDRSGPKIFVGEWASIGARPTPDWRSALGDAAWLTGLERNSDVVLMEAYAPLFVNVNEGAAQWPTNLIGYDSLCCFGSPSYWVQSLFAKNTGDTVIPTSLKLDLPKQQMPHFQGGIGVGTWRTQSEYKDVEVIKGGQVVSIKNAVDWHLGNGDWGPDGDALKQSGNRRDTRATAGDPSWTDYELHLKARKVGGSEGFLILFHYKDDSSFWMWNVGGWGNTTSDLQYCASGSATQLGQPVPTHIETGKWYDIRVQLQGGTIRCYLDGKLVNEATPEQVEALTADPGPLFVAASSGHGGNELFLKVVNVSEGSVPLTVNLQGSGGWSQASAWMITGALKDQNSVNELEKIVPKALPIEEIGPSFQHTFPGHSVTVLKLHRT